MISISQTVRLLGYLHIYKSLTMKKYIYLALLASIAFSGCQDDDNIDPYLLHHDGENVTSPFLPSGAYEAAAHFNSNVAIRYVGKELIAIEFNMYELPDYAQIRVYESTGQNNPGGVLFTQIVTNEIIPFSWNRFDLPTAIDLDGGIWVGVYFEHFGRQAQTMGCDGGPSAGNGDWLWDEADSQWLSYFSRTSESINWNIQGVLQDK